MLKLAGVQRSKIRRILVPLDGSKRSINAVEFAVDLAKACNSEIDRSKRNKARNRRKNQGF